MLYKMFDIVDMGDDMTEYTARWSAESFNAFEDNLATINLLRLKILRVLDALL